MTTNSTLFRKDLTKIILLPVLTLFFIPLIALLFVHHATSLTDAKFLPAIEQKIDSNPSLSIEERVQAKQFFRANPPSGVCGKSDPEFANYRAGVCALWSEGWQHYLAGKVAFWSLVAGGVVLLLVTALGATAFINRRAQYLSFLVGWRMLTLVSAIEVVVQGGLAVWLSFWVTAVFFHVYSIKLIALIGIGAAVGIFHAVYWIFKRLPLNNGIDGQLLTPSDAPALWAHIRQLASRLQTRAPDQIVAGIDSNFFVTEAPLTVAGSALTGRTLFISLPLLRVLDRPEADAVLVHELAHLQGGDTASSAALGPKLVQFDHYCQMMWANGTTRLVYYLLRLYRVMFELALRRDSRAREFLADLIASQLISPSAIIHALIKVAAYARFRGEIERSLFEQDRRLQGSLGIARFIADGLAPYAASSHFLNAMQTASVPHPFDSHPPLTERMANVGINVREQDYGRIAATPPGSGWLDDVQAAPGIEERLWAAYEQRFAAVHEQQLAYRLIPSSDEERAIVLRYFPPVVFPLRGSKQVEVNYLGLLLPGKTDVLSWDNVTNLKYVDGIGGDVLTIVHAEKGWFGAKSSKVKLPGIRKDRARFKGTLSHYWQRHQVMRKATARPVA